MSIFRELYAYRQMLKSMVVSDLRTRYKGSILGFLWTFLNPLLMLTVYTIIFSTIMRMNIEHYAVFMFIGLLPWINFSSTLVSSTSVIIRNSNLVKKIYFPREVLPLSVVAGGIVNYLYGLIIMVAAIYISGMTLSYLVIFFPIILLIQIIITVALSLLLSSLTVFFRDLEHIMGILTMAWFYFTPIIFPTSSIPEKYRSLFNLNPVKPIFEAYQDIFYYKIAPDWKSLGIATIYYIVLLILSSIIFKYCSKRFAEEV